MAKTTSPFQFEWDVLYVGASGFGEHIVVRADDPEALVEGKQKIIDALKSEGAIARWQDEKRNPSYSQPYNKTGGGTDQMEKAAQDFFGAKVTQDVEERRCPVDGSPMTYKPGGTSRNKVDRNGNPKKYNARYECPQCQRTDWLNNN